MRSRLSKIALMIFASVLSACVTFERPLQNDQFQVISAYVQAYNERDIEAMSGVMHPDIQWLSIEGDQVTVIADGKRDLVKQMNEYFLSPSSTTSKVTTHIFNNQFIATNEIARWQGVDGSVHQQSAMAVYEINSGLILHVWYYPSD